uniref:DOMON domain-containing protein n=1 Tax=Steinernema glaseri TaxID=37863 RepID=A0A1I7Z3S0_9BILA
MIAVGLLFLLCLLGQVHGSEDKCSFNSENYSLRWRYEKSTNNVIFFLKTAGNGENFWSGVGFGDRKQNVSTDFISVFVKNGQFGLADMHANKMEQLLSDTFTNVQVISFDVEKGKLMAQFSRSLTSMDENDVDLKGCTRFFFPVRPFSSKESDMKVLKDADLTNKVICDIAKECEIDDSGLVSGGSDKKVEFAESVDVSGTGDPCSFKGQTYNVSWKYDKQLDTVNFTMEVPMKGGKWWSAVGIGDTMQDMDIFAMFLDNGILKSHGDFFSSGYTVPAKDDSQDWTVDEKAAKVVDGVVHLQFSRKMETEDKKNDRSLDGCVLFQFAANLGKYGSKFSIRKHEDWPDLYKACDLKQKCEGRKRRKVPRFAQQKDDAIQSVEASGDDAEEPFTTTEMNPAEVVETVQKIPQNVAPQNSSSEDESLLTTAAVQPITAPASEDSPSQDTVAPQAAEAASTNATLAEATTEASTEAPIVSRAPEDAPSPPALEVPDSPAPDTQQAASSTAPSTEVPVTAEETTESPSTLEAITTVSTEAPPAPEVERTTSEAPVVVTEATTAETPAATERSETPGASTTEEVPKTFQAGVTANASSTTEEECEDNHEDLPVCKGYIDEYFGEVKEWADKHKETLETQAWKVRACSLLQKVPHVPSLCCTSFLAACRNHLPPPKPHSGRI